MSSTVKPKEQSKRAKTYRWGSLPKKKPVPSPIVPPAGCFERGRIEIKDVRVSLQHKDLDLHFVKMIQETFLFTGGGSFQPIGIRRVKEDGNDVIQNVLVFGAKRLQAQKNAGLKHIDCVYLSGTDTDVELIQVAENFLRKNHTVLEDAEQTVRFYSLVGKKLAISGQLDQKNRRLGRRPGGIAQPPDKIAVSDILDEEKQAPRGHIKSPISQLHRWDWAVPKVIGSGTGAELLSELAGVVIPETSELRA